MRELTQTDFEEWKELYATKAWFGVIVKLRKELSDMLASGGTVHAQSIEGTAIQTVNTVAKIEILDEILNYEVE